METKGSPLGRISVDRLAMSQRTVQPFWPFAESSFLISRVLDQLRNFGAPRFSSLLFLSEGLCGLPHLLRTRARQSSQCPVLKSLRFRGLSCRLLPTAVVRRSRPDWLYEYFVDDDVNLWIFLYITKNFFLNFFFVMCSKIFKQFFLFKIFFLRLYCRCLPVFFYQ